MTAIVLTIRPSDSDADSIAGWAQNKVGPQENEEIELRAGRGLEPTRHPPLGRHTPIRSPAGGRETAGDAVPYLNFCILREKVLDS